MPTFNMGGPGMGGIAGLFVFVSFLVSVGVAIFWMVCGWRAMRAHEKLADAMENLSRKQPPTQL